MKYKGYYVNKKLIMLAVLSASQLGLLGAANGTTISEAVNQTIRTNPDVLIDANRKLSIDEAVKQAEGGYYPKIDFNLGYGNEWSKNITTRPRRGGDDTLTRRESGLSLSQLIYDGSATRSEVDRQQARSSSASRKVMGTSEQIGLKAIEAYLNVLRRTELLKLAQANLDVHEKTFTQIRIRSEGGIGRKADLDQAQARLSLSQANVASAEANLREANIAYNRVVGVMPDSLVKPEVTEAPASVDEALNVSLESNPILRSAMADIEAAQAQNRTAESLLKPRLHLELGTSFNNDLDGVNYKNNDAYAMLRMRYNLFNGGSDVAKTAETTIQIQEATEVFHRTQRQVEESLRLSWNSMVTAQDRLPKLLATAEAAARTRDGYAQQFNLGQRTLLDLLDSENELYIGRSNYLDAQYIDLFSRYRLMADMGKLLGTLGVDPREESKEVAAK
jgi:adhesin transport system outer membrane protein